MSDKQGAGLTLALRFHEIYERLAPSFGYETRQDTRVFDPESKNGRLMIAVCEKIARAEGVPVGAIDLLRAALPFIEDDGDDAIAVYRAIDAYLDEHDDAAPAPAPTDQSAPDVAGLMKRMRGAIEVLRGIGHADAEQVADTMADALATIERLIARVAELERISDEEVSDRKKAEAELKAAREDAARFRWLMRDVSCNVTERATYYKFAFVTGKVGQTLIEAIDAALAKWQACS